ncbi:hypothetical protein [Rhizobium flavescens]|uniref:hypothetical protein n=1 Tax=Rhizobium flavescens TaxID=2607407 RepID=UPI001408C5C8|nr:hypothetical protein [Rhizobium flavescens]
MHILDERLFGSEQYPLDYASGYNWVESIDRYSKASLSSGVALLLHEVQKHAEDFERGGFVAYFEDRLQTAVVNAFRTEVEDIPCFAAELVEKVKGVLPGLERLDANADTALLLSIYGKVCNKLPEHTRARLVTADVQGGVAAVFNQERPRMEVIRKAIRNRGVVKNEALTVRDVVEAALETVTAYTAHLEKFDMGMTEEDAYYIKDVVVKLRSHLAYRGEPVDDIDAVMTRFENAASAVAGTTAVSGRGNHLKLAVDNTAETASTALSF